MAPLLYLRIPKGRGGKSIEINQSVEGDSKLKALVSQLNDLATKIKEVENRYKLQGKQSLPHEQEISRSDDPLALPPSGLPFLPMVCSPGAGLPRFVHAAFSPDGLCQYCHPPRWLYGQVVPRCCVLLSTLLTEPYMDVTAHTAPSQQAKIVSMIRY
ncbi:hypothetical protein KY289_016439 [Solanum tuberosum]|nr:hypothetical protein KY289_016439 [Solanum tuberosum]